MGFFSDLTGGGSRGAADAQVDATNKAKKQINRSLKETLDTQERALAETKSMFGEALKLNEPYRDSGQKALAFYESMLYGIPVEQTASYSSAIKAQQSPAAQMMGSVGDILNRSQGKWTSGKAENQGTTLYLNSATGEIGDTGDIELGKRLTAEEMELSKGERNALISQKAQDAFAGLNQDVVGDTSMFQGTDVTQPYDWQTSPGYQFRLEEGEKALERGAAARSGLLSGRQSKALQRYGQDTASLEYDKILGRLGGLVDKGAAAASQSSGQAFAQGGQAANVLGNSAQYQFQTGQALAGAESQIGAARASGYLGSQAASGRLFDAAVAINYGGDVSTNLGGGQDQGTAIGS